jgi:hypothetical protein
MTLTELEHCVRIVMRHAANSGITDIVPEGKDLYWTVSSPDWLEIYKAPNPSVGSFDDDEAELQKLITDEARVSSVDLVRVAHLLRLVSDQLSSVALL